MGTSKGALPLHEPPEQDLGEVANPVTRRFQRLNQRLQRGGMPWISDVGPFRTAPECNHRQRGPAFPGRLLLSFRREQPRLNHQPSPKLAGGLRMHDLDRDFFGGSFRIDGFVDAGQRSDDVEATGFKAAVGGHAVDGFSVAMG